MGLPGGGSGGSGGLAPLIPWVVVALIIYLWYSSKKKKNVQQGQDYFTQTFNSEPAYSFFHSGTGIAISNDLKQIGFIDGGRQKVYGVENIRGHEAKKVHSGEVVGVGVSGGLAALSANIRAQRKARNQSGLFVQVKDIDNPEWHIDMPNEQDQSR